MTQFVDILGYERIAAHASALPFAPKRERFIFVRHGETEGNRNRVYQFPHTPLNETGEGQAALAAKALATTRIGKLVASPMARAWRTASLIAAEHKMHPEADGALSERFYVSLWDKPIEGEFNWDWDPDGCEPLATFVQRAAQSIDAHPRRRQPRRRDGHRRARRRPADRLRADPGNARTFTSSKRRSAALCARKRRMDRDAVVILIAHG